MTGGRPARNPRASLTTLAAAVLALSCAAEHPAQAGPAVPDLPPRPVEVEQPPSAPIAVELPRPRPAIPEQVVTDRYSGVAIAGFDPVAYFEGTPTPGTGANEFTYAGAVWQFRSAANRAAFMANPEVYAPRFGGYDPVGVARGVGVPGNPRLWQLHHDRLYLFYTPAGREAFAADPDAVINAAEQAWPQVVKTILP